MKYLEYSLIGVDGNAFAIIGYITRAMKKEGKNNESIEEYRKNAMSGNYDNLLCVSQNMIDELNG